MLFWTHLIFGFFCLMLFVGRVNNWVGFLLLGLIGAVFLDIDSYTSKIGKRGISRVLMAFNSHRGIVHSLIFVFFLYFVLKLVFGQIALGFLIGALSHLFLDCFTRRGVRLFFPFRLRVNGFMRSGGFFEILLFLVFLILDVFLVMAYLVSGL